MNLSPIYQYCFIVFPFKLKNESYPETNDLKAVVMIKSKQN